MNHPGIKYTASSNTRFFTGNSQVPAGTAVIPSFTHTFGLDPDCPFYRIFAGAAGSLFIDGNGFVSQFDFSLGGVSCGNPAYFSWGDETAYNSATSGVTQGLNLIPGFSGDGFVIHSQYAVSCALIQPYTTAAGMVTRWTAIADKVVIITSQIGTPATTTENSEIYHGVLQQPF